MGPAFLFDVTVDKNFVILKKRHSCIINGKQHLVLREYRDFLFQRAIIRIISRLFIHETDLMPQQQPHQALQMKNQ